MPHLMNKLDIQQRSTHFIALSNECHLLSMHEIFNTAAEQSDDKDQGTKS